MPAFSTESEVKCNVNHAIAAANKSLGNTPAMYRKCYVHPIILDTCLTGEPLFAAQVLLNRQDNGGHGNGWVQPEP